MNNGRTRELVLTGIFLALITVMTVIPYTGYINYGLIEITTLHLVVILGGVALGWKGGTLLGFYWGATCLMRAFTNPAWILFTNPLISLAPRVVVGLVAGLGGDWIVRGNRSPLAVSAVAAAATMTNTILVLSAIYVFGGMIQSYAAVFELFKTIMSIVITVNGSLELGAAVLLTPVFYAALQRSGALRRNMTQAAA